MAQTISLDKETFKALAGETRIQILKELKERQKTQSELAARLHLSAPTVNEHLSLLKKAGLVQEIDDGHKWKYFQLSSKGKSILNPENEKQILLVLSFLTVAFVGFLFLFFSQFSPVAFSENEMARNTVAPMLQSATGASEDIAYKALAENSVSNAAPVIALQQSILPQIVLIIACALFIGLLAGYLLKRRN